MNSSKRWQRQAAGDAEASSRCVKRGWALRLGAVAGQGASSRHGRWGSFRLDAGDAEGLRLVGGWGWGQHGASSSGWGRAHVISGRGD